MGGNLGESPEKGGVVGSNPTTGSWSLFTPADRVRLIQPFFYCVYAVWEVKEPLSR